MVIISDTSPLSNLLIIDKLDILHQVVGNIVIPQSVFNEVVALDDFNINTESFKNAAWIVSQNPDNEEFVNHLLNELDRGEAEAIALALQLNADYIIMDEKICRSVVQKYNIETIGLLGILIKGKEIGVIASLKPILDDLIQVSGFWISEELYQEILRRVNE